MIFYSYQLRVYAGKRERISRRGKIRLISSGYEKRKKRKEKNAILRVYTGFPGPVQEFVRAWVFDFKASLLGQHNRAIRIFSRSKVGTHENILHFSPRFTRCILWRLDWKSITRDWNRGSRQTGWYFLSSACPSSYPSLDTWISRHRSNNLNS